MFSFQQNIIRHETEKKMYDQNTGQKQKHPTNEKHQSIKTTFEEAQILELVDRNFKFSV